MKTKTNKIPQLVFLIIIIVAVLVAIIVRLAQPKQTTPEAPQETLAQPTETVVPTPTPTETLPQPSSQISVSIDLPDYDGYSFTDSQKALISNCAFVGDSICSGLYVYGVLPQNIVVAVGNVGIRSIDDYTFKVNGGEYNALDALTVIAPKYVIFSMGMNDINITSAETYCENYLDMLKRTHERLPQSKLYVASITPIDAASSFASNDKINRYNAAVKQAVEDAGYNYIDIATSLRDSSGGMNSRFSGGDGIHINKSGYYSILTDVVNQIG